MDIKISVVIPCYNVQNFLQICMESVERQTIFPEIEVILIDDGSYDNTYFLAESYSRKHQNIRLFQQNHAGSGRARNLGIAKANGKYIAFMDADDFYPDDNVLNDLYIEAEKRGAAMCGGSLILYDDGIYMETGGYLGTTVRQAGWVDKSEYPNAAGYWLSIYKKRMLVENEITFPDYLRGQDVVFFARALSAAGKAYRIRRISYVYRRGHKTEIYTEEKMRGQIMARRDVLDISFHNGMNKIFETAVWRLHDACGYYLYYLLLNGYDDMRDILQQYNDFIRKSILFKRGDVELFEENEKVYMEKMKRKREKIMQTVTQAKYLCIYGAGIVGKELLQVIRQERENVDCFLVTNAAGNAQMCGNIPVYEAADYLKGFPDSLVLIAVSAHLIPEIKNYLESLGHRNYLVLERETVEVLHSNILSAKFDEGRK